MCIFYIYIYIFSVYILCIFCFFGWVRARIPPSPPTAHKKPRAPLPQHSTLSLRNSGHDHHNDHDDMVTITMMIMMPGPDDNLLDDIVPFVHFPHPDAFDKSHNVTQY